MTSCNHENVAYRTRAQAEALAVTYLVQRFEYQRPYMVPTMREEEAISMMQNTPYGARIVAAFCATILKIRREA